MAKQRSCYKCVPPKRFPGCHATCPDYAKDDAEHQARKEKERQAKAIDSILTSQKCSAVYKAMRHNRKKG